MEHEQARRRDAARVQHHRPWWIEPMNVLTLVEQMMESGFGMWTAERVLRVFEKPWKWDLEWQVWVALGQPTTDDQGHDKRNDTAWDAWPLVVDDIREGRHLCGGCGGELIANPGVWTQALSPYFVNDAQSIGHTGCVIDRLHDEHKEGAFMDIEPPTP